MEKHTVDADASEQGKNAMSLYFFFFQSVVLAVLFPIVVRCSGRHALIAVWRLSLLLCTYFYSAVCVLSIATRKSKVYLACAAVLALVVDAVLSHVAGTVIMYLATVWIAGVFGRALAEHNTASSAENSREKLAGESGLIIFLSLVFSACGMIPICVIMAAPRGALHLSSTQEDLVGLLPILLCFCLPVIIVCTMKHLRRGGAVVLGLGVECHPGKVLVLCYSSSFIIFTLNFILIIEVAAVVILGLAVFFGYSYCNATNPCFLARSKPKVVAPPAVEVRERQTVASADGGNKEQTEISPNSNTTVPN